MFINKISNSINRTLINCGIKTRPEADVGFWTLFLLPVAIIISLGKNVHIVSVHYKLASFVATGFIIISVVVIVRCIKYKNSSCFDKLSVAHYLTAAYTSSLFYTCLHKSVIFSLVSGFGTTLLYAKGLPLLLRICPQSFTFGEASIVVQSVVLFLYMALLNVYESLENAPTKIQQISNLIIQIGMTGIGLIIFITYNIKMFRKAVPFYFLIISVIIFWMLLPMRMLIGQNPIMWIIDRLTYNSSTVKMVAFWLVCLSLAAVAINEQVKKGRRANTMVRKIFHILAVLVFLSGLLDQCSILYLASGIFFALFGTLEMLRILNIPPFASALQNGYTVFCDEKDAGGIALTPLYLLAGVSIPLWIHPETCDVTDSFGFHLLPLISGVISVGIGDTLASTFGVLFGRHKWTGTKKTFEGTIASIFGQFLIMYLLIYSGYIVQSGENILKAVVAIVVSSVIEAKTDQVDNLILPFVTFIILI